MKQYQRADNISNFTTDPETKVLLLSMRAGAAGLNLMAANYCFLMDPATNAAIEEQAIDRIHRYVRLPFHFAIIFDYSLSLSTALGKRGQSPSSASS